MVYLKKKNEGKNLKRKKSWKIFHRKQVMMLNLIIRIRILSNLNFYISFKSTVRYNQYVIKHFYNLFGIKGTKFLNKALDKGKNLIEKKQVSRWIIIRRSIICRKYRNWCWHLIIKYEKFIIYWNCSRGVDALFKISPLQD